MDGTKTLVDEYAGDLPRPDAVQVEPVGYSQQLALFDRPLPPTLLAHFAVTGQGR
jgi:hypothetical protein